MVRLRQDIFRHVTPKRDAKLRLSSREECAIEKHFRDSDMYDCIRIGVCKYNARAFMCIYVLKEVFLTFGVQFTQRKIMK